MSPGRDRLRERAPGWILAALFVAGLTPFLTRIYYNFDEGLYIFQARMILDGLLPYRDFFYHQTPLYPFTLAAAGLPADTLFAYRFVSLVATGLTGVVVYRLALRAAPPAVALLAALLFYTSPLQIWGTLALPNALMMLFSTAGVAVVFFGSGRGSAVLGGALLALSILYKPLSLAAGLAVGIAVLASRARRPRAPWILAGGAAVGLSAWAGFHLATGGLFTRVLELQLLRYSSESGFEVMRSFAPFAERLDKAGIETATQWNLHEHARAFFRDRSKYPNHQLAGLAALGQILVWTPLGRPWRDQRLLLTLWWSLPLAASIWLWEPVWDHYFVQYLPGFALLAAAPLACLWQLPRGRAPARVAALALAGYLALLGPGFWKLRLTDYGPLERSGAAGQSWLTWDPFLNVVSGTRPACGVIDWINVYGDRSLTATRDRRAWSRFHVEPRDLIACLEADSSIRIGRGFWSTFYLDDEVRAYLAGQPPERFVSLHDF